MPVTNVVDFDLVHRIENDITERIETDSVMKSVLNAIRSGSLTRLEKNDDATDRYDASTFTNTVGKDPDPTNQGSAGTCWIHGALNMMRRDFIGRYELPSNFSFSIPHLQFWDKIEKFNEALELIIQLRRRSINDDSLHAAYSHGVSDGGWFHTARDLILKYGVVPESAFSCRYNANHTSLINHRLKLLIIEFASKVKRINGDCPIDLEDYDEMAIDSDYKPLNVKTTLPKAECIRLKEEYMECAVKILVYAIGNPIYPDSKFDWTYIDKNGKKYIAEQITPLTFLNDYCCFDYSKYVVITNDPRPRYPYYYKYARNKYDQRRPIRNGEYSKVDLESYINLPMRDIRQLVQKQIDEGIPVAFTCDVNKYVDHTNNVMSLDVTEYGAAFGIPFYSTMSKADRIDFSVSWGNHIMTIVGYDVPGCASDEGDDSEDDEDEDGDTEIDDVEEESDDIPEPSAKRQKGDANSIGSAGTVKEMQDSSVPQHYKVENSWGKYGTHKGYYLMNLPWMSEYTYDFVIHRDHLPAYIQRIDETIPTEIREGDGLAPIANDEESQRNMYRAQAMIDETMTPNQKCRYKRKREF